MFSFLLWQEYLTWNLPSEQGFKYSTLIYKFIHVVLCCRTFFVLRLNIPLYAQSTFTLSFHLLMVLLWRTHFILSIFSYALYLFYCFFSQLMLLSSPFRRSFLGLKDTLWYLSHILWEYFWCPLFGFPP